MSEPHCTSCEAGEVRAGWKLKASLMALASVFAVSYLPAFSALHESFMSYFSMIWWAVLLGLFLGGIIDYFVPDDFVFSYLNRGRSSLLYAVLAGFLMSACSHGILALAIQLHKKGASIPAVVTFLMATPWANLPVTLLLFSFFGWKALLFVGAAMVIALVTGSVFITLEKAGLIEQSPEREGDLDLQWNKVQDFDAREAAGGVLRGSVNLANMVLWWIVIGFLFAVFMRAYVPSELFLRYFGPGLPGLLLTLLFATLIEVCSEGSAPIAFEIFRRVGKLGNPFVFLVAGVATDYTEIGLLWTNVGKKTAAWLPVVAVPQVLLAGWLFNALL